SGDTAGILLTRHYTDNTEDSKVPAAKLLAHLRRHLPIVMNEAWHAIAIETNSASLLEALPV
ncbi:MAG: hypothetical protein K6T81_20400, partial [Alicyclobacillus macrosporangiidus]|uniref:hypothetical protein n=1 Tax=Alicyclobacillus macrosporangiidus TaxID=392015 RepID=UPI0026EBEFA8